ncbi:MAG: carboxypeptidase-like regulatory domain-containing protein, partial [Acidobacteriota bacterium]
MTLLSAAPTFAQSVGAITGTVLDTSKSSLPGAVVTARNEGTGVTREVVTDVAGRYSMPLLPVGSYTVTATMTGFQSQERSKVSLEVQATLTLNFTLDIAGLTSEVTVMSEAAVVQLQRSDASLGQLINAQQV